MQTLKRTKRQANSEIDVLKQKIQILEKEKKELSTLLGQYTVSEKRLKDIFENAPIGIYFSTPEGRILTANSTLVRMMGCDSFEELIQIDLEKKWYHADYPRSEFKRKIDMEGKIADYESVWIRKDGIEIRVLENAVAVRDYQDKVFYEGTVMDITEKKKTEQTLIEERYLLRTLMECIPDHIYFKDRNSRFIRNSKSLANRFGIADSIDLAGKWDFDFFSREHARQAYQDEQNIIKTGKPLVGIEERETWIDGNETWVSTTKMPLRNAEGQIVGTFGVSRDITAQKLSEIKLKETLKQLKRSNEELELFAHVASHDLKEPLRMVIFYLSLLSDRYQKHLDDDAREFIHYAVDGARRMYRLISDLLNYSRVTTQGKPFTETPMEEVLARVLANLKVAIEESQANVKHDPLPAVVADDAQMERLLQNLIGNAIKYRGNHPPEVQVSAKQGRNGWIFSVRDNGIGIHPRHFEQIFEIFKRLHKKDKYTGSGIGLAECRKIVERHGGRIWLESEERKGSTFYFTIGAGTP